MTTTTLTALICPEHGQAEDRGLYGTCSMGVVFYTDDGRRGVEACGKDLQEIVVQPIPPHTEEPPTP